MTDKPPKFKIVDIIRLSKYKILLQKVTFQIGLKKVLWLKELKTQCRGHTDLKSEEIVGTFYKNELKENQKEFRVEKVITRKGSKLYVKWKSYDSSYNGWIDRKKTI